MSQFQFLWAMNILALKAEASFFPHIAPQGEAQTRFNQALRAFIDIEPQFTLHGKAKSTWKTISDFFKKVYFRLQASFLDKAKNQRALEIINVCSKRRTLLEHFTLELDGFDN